MHPAWAVAELVVIRRTINTQNENVVPIVRAFILWQDDPARKIVERRRLLRSPPSLSKRSADPISLGRAQNASGAPAWEKASTGVASSTFASNQNLQTNGVTNVVSSQAMTAIPLPMER